MENEVITLLADIRRLLTTTTKDVLTTKDVAILTGMSESHIRHLVMRREIPFYKPQGRLYFKKSEIEDWMLQDRHPSIYEQVNNYLNQ